MATPVRSAVATPRISRIIRAKHSRLDDARAQPEGAAKARPGTKLPTAILKITLLIISAADNLQKGGSEDRRQDPCAENKRRPRNHVHEIHFGLFELFGIPPRHDEIQPREHDKKDDNGERDGYDYLETAYDKIFQVAEARETAKLSVWIACGRRCDKGQQKRRGRRPERQYVCPCLHNHSRKMCSSS